MTRDDLERFLERVSAASLGEYLGKVGRDEAILALEERVGWAIAHHDDPLDGDVAEFLARNADALKSVLDEGEAAWWERTATSPRVRKPERSDTEAWKGIETFTTPPVAPGRGANPTIVAEPGETPEAPPRDRGVLPEAIDTPGSQSRVVPPSEDTWIDEVPVDPDSTDPIGFVAVPLSAADRERDARLAATPAPLSPREHALTFGHRSVSDDEPTDPSGPRVPQRPPPTAPVAAPAQGGSRWSSWLAMIVGTLLLALGIVALGFVVARLGSQQGRTFAEEAWRDAHVTSSTTAETPPGPDPAPVPSPVAPSASPAPAPAMPVLRDPGFLPPSATPLARSTWVGTGGQGALTLHIDAQQGSTVRGRLVRVTGGLSQTTPVTGTLDATTGALALKGEGVELTGTLTGTTLRGTWSPDGTTRQWVLARQ